MLEDRGRILAGQMLEVQADNERLRADNYRLHQLAGSVITLRHQDTIRLESNIRQLVAERLQAEAVYFLFYHLSNNLIVSRLI